MPDSWPFGDSSVAPLAVSPGAVVARVQVLAHVMALPPPSVVTHPLAEPAACAHTCATTPDAHDADVQLYRASEPLVEMHIKPAATV